VSTRAPSRTAATTTTTTTMDLRRRANQLVAIALHTLGIFVLPLATAAGLVAATAASEVQETAGRAVVVVAAVAMPLLLLQVTGVVVRARRLWRQRVDNDGRAGGLGAVVDVLFDASTIVTRRGGWVIATGLCGLAAAIVVGWAQFVVFAVAVLAACLLVVAVASLTATFGVRAVDAACATRTIEPAVAGVGDTLLDTFVVDAVVPRGFSLRITGPRGARLGGQTRLFVDGHAHRRRTRASVPLPQTPRGVHVLPPASVVLEDLFGLTAVVVGDTSAARCKVLPRLKPVVGAETVLSAVPRADDVVLPQPRPREELFDLRSFVRGDDVRRIHWKQSVRAGEWIVRTPEANPTQSRQVVLVLDTFVEPGVAVTDEDHAATAAVLDVVVEAWLGVACALRAQGHAVTLVAAVPDDDGVVAVQVIEGRKVRDAAWRDLGARAVGQSRVPLTEVIGERPDAVVVTAGLGAPGSAPGAAGRVRVVVDALPLVPATLPDVLRWSWRSLFLLPHDAGSDDNLPGAVALRKRKDKERVGARSALRACLQALRVGLREGDIRVQRNARTLSLVPAKTTNTTTTDATTNATTKNRRVA
jgi:uncharacterized protein (DUF58 family)